MEWVKAVRVNEQKLAANAADTAERSSTRKINIMKTLTKLALALTILSTAVAAQADWPNI